MYKKIKELEEFCLDEHTNNLYKKEARSSIGLAREVAAKLNEVIKSFNELAKEKHEKIQEQDGKIRGAIVYMKDNLLNTIDKLLDLKGEQMIDNSVKEYLDSLKAELDLLESRLNNLLGSVINGSTTMDSEIIDARTGFDGKKYLNLGESIRNQQFHMKHIHKGNYKDELPDLNDCIFPRYLLNFATNDNELPLNLPFANMPEAVVLLENYKTGVYQIQVLSTKGKVYTRINGGYSWSEWSCGGYFNSLVNSTNYKTILPDLNNAKDNDYCLLFAEGTKSENLPANMPIEEVFNVIGVLKTHTMSNYKWQEYITGGKLYTRYYGNSVWSKWSSSDEPKYVTIKASNYLTQLPDIDNCEVNKTYILNFAEGTSEMPANLPFSTIPDVLMFVNTYRSGNYGYQEIRPANHKFLYRRMYAFEWQKWILVYSNDNEEATIRTNTTNGILNGLKECYENGIKKLVVEAGEYDIIKEYENYYGSDYFTNYVNYETDDKFDRGLWLEDIELIFSPGAKVECHYTGNNSNVPYYFTPFAVGNNVVINGLVLNASGCRYGIHPDFNTGANRSYMKILNCDLKHFKSANNEQCIGSGFGKHVEWLVENTIFRSDDKNIVFRVHNNVSSEAQSKLIVKNCYIDGQGYFQFNHYSTSEKESTILVSGCSYINEPVVDFETTDSINENMKLIKFNNEVRTA